MVDWSSVGKRSLYWGFTVFIYVLMNDLPIAMDQGQISLHADDTELHYHGEELQ